MRKTKKREKHGKRHWTVRQLYINLHFSKIISLRWQAATRIIRITAKVHKVYGQININGGNAVPFHKNDS